VRYVFVRAEKANYPVTVLCRVLEVSRPGFYAWCKRPESKRAGASRALRVRIKAVHQKSRGTYGSPRVHATLVSEGTHVGRARVAKLMQAEGLCARRKKRFVRTTDSKHNLPVAGNVLDRQFSPTEPDKVWATDITYIWTKEGWLYLAVIIDLFSRLAVGWSMSERIDRHLVLSALGMAKSRRWPPAGLLHHSDRGSQYASEDYRKALEMGLMICSMSRKGNCWDNAVAESFFSTLKMELVHQTEFATRDTARTAIFEYIEAFYNRERRHSSLGYLSPEDFEREAVHAKLAA
jgi:putative transposase